VGVAQWKYEMSNVKKTLWLWSAVNHWYQGILSWVIGDTPGGRHAFAISQR
jgi:IS1 family transposase